MASAVTNRPYPFEECAIVLDLWRQADATPSVRDNPEELQGVVGENGDLFLIAEKDSRVAGTVTGGGGMTGEETSTGPRSCQGTGVRVLGGS